MNLSLPPINIIIIANRNHFSNKQITQIQIATITSYLRPAGPCHPFGWERFAAALTVLVTVDTRTRVVVINSVTIRALAINVVIDTRVIVLAGLVTVDMRTCVTVDDLIGSVTVCSAICTACCVAHVALKVETLVNVLVLMRVVVLIEA
jgi:hypothetical protein